MSKVVNSTVASESKEDRLLTQFYCVASIALLSTYTPQKTSTTLILGAVLSKSIDEESHR